MSHTSFFSIKLLTEIFNELDKIALKKFQEDNK